MTGLMNDITHKHSNDCYQFFAICSHYHWVMKIQKTTLLISYLNAVIGLVYYFLGYR